MSTQQIKLKEIADAIRAKKGTTDLIVANDFANEISTIEGGGDGYIDNFYKQYDGFYEFSKKNIDDSIAMWEESGILPTDTSYAKLSKYKDRITFLPRINYSGVTGSANSLISGYKYVEYLENLDLSNCSSASSLLQNNTSLKLVRNINIQSAKECSFMFANCSALTDIGIINVSSSTNVTNMFQNCTLIKNAGGLLGLSVSISLSASNLLSPQSIDNVINTIKDMTGQTSPTITLHADVKGNLTSEQLAGFAAKNWTIA